MKKRIQIFFTCVLMSMYAIASIFGHVLVFHEFINCSSNEKRLSTEKNSRNPSSVPLWTQKKHIPVVQKEDLQNHFFNKPNYVCNNLQVIGIVYPTSFFFKQVFVSQKSRPRSPPYYSISL
jgi:hypothetical protein